MYKKKEKKIIPGDTLFVACVLEIKIVKNLKEIANKTKTKVESLFKGKLIYTHENTWS